MKTFPFPFGALALGLTCTALAARPAHAAFGLTSTESTYTVDSGAGLTFSINRSNGDLTSLQFREGELQDLSGKNSQVNTGLGNATVRARTVGPNFIVIECETPSLTHYYAARRGFNNIYLATYVVAEPRVGELRYIFRLQKSRLPQAPKASNLTGNNRAIEGQDVFALPNGQTRSKYFARDRAIDLNVRGVTGPGVGAYMFYGSRESSSGGPFFRDIQNQTGAQQEIYNQMNSGRAQTEPLRSGVLNGPYVLALTDGSAPPAAVDTAWMSQLDLLGWVSERGSVRGIASGLPAGFEGVVGFANSAAQSWAKVDAATGAFASPPLKPGTYKMTLYQGELEVGTANVTVAAGATPTVQNIASGEVNLPVLWRIGEWDGTPKGFLNADQLIQMHPSDTRMSAWKPTTYVVDAKAKGAFPAAQWKAVNNPTTIRFSLSAAQVRDYTLRVGITTAYSNARPQVAINGTALPVPAPAAQPKSRSLTLGTYRGNNAVFATAIAASALKEGSNTLTLSVVGGTGGTRFLSPGLAYDALELAPVATTGAKIAEFRFSGPGGARDEYVEITNNSDVALNLSGWTLQNGDGTPLATVPREKYLPPRGHLLLTGTGYSLANVGGAGAARGDIEFAADLSGGIGLRNAAGVLVDRVGVPGSRFAQGAGLVAAVANSQHAFVRKANERGLQDTKDNRADFDLVDAAPAVIPAANATAPNAAAPNAARLGTPNPQNLHSALSGRRALAAPSDPDATAPLGTIALRRTFTNATGKTLTQLRFRVVDATAGAPATGSNAADVRLLSSAATLTVNGQSVPVLPLVLENGATQPGGGALNSTLVADLSALPSGGIAPGTTFRVEFALGVVKRGGYRVALELEAR